MLLMNLKKMDIFDRLIHGFGFALAGVFLFVLLAGVVVALLSILLEGKSRGAKIRAVPEAVNDDAALTEGGHNLLEGGETRVG